MATGRLKVKSIVYEQSTYKNMGKCLCGIVGNPGFIQTKALGIAVMGQTVRIQKRLSRQVAGMGLQDHCTGKPYL
jgi:hypothetical protein